MKCSISSYDLCLLGDRAILIKSAALASSSLLYETESWTINLTETGQDLLPLDLHLTLTWPRKSPWRRKIPSQKVISNNSFREECSREWSKRERGQAKPAHGTNRTRECQRAPGSGSHGNQRRSSTSPPSLKHDLILSQLIYQVTRFPAIGGWCYSRRANRKG